MKITEINQRYLENQKRGVWPLKEPDHILNTKMFKIIFLFIFFTNDSEYNSKNNFPTPKFNYI